MTIENKYACKNEFINVGVKLCFIHIKSVVMLFYWNRRCDTFIFKYMFLINIQHTNTHIESSMVVTDQTVYLQLVTMLILIIWHLLKKITSIEYHLCPVVTFNCYRIAKKVLHGRSV